MVDKRLRTTELEEITQVKWQHDTEVQKLPEPDAIFSTARIEAKANYDCGFTTHFRKSTQLPHKYDKRNFTYQTQMIDAVDNN